MIRVGISWCTRGWIGPQQLGQHPLTLAIDELLRRREKRTLVLESRQTPKRVNQVKKSKNKSMQIDFGCIEMLLNPIYIII